LGFPISTTHALVGALIGARRQEHGEGGAEPDGGQKGGIGGHGRRNQTLAAEGFDQRGAERKRRERSQQGGYRRQPKRGAVVQRGAAIKRRHALEVVVGPVGVREHEHGQQEKHYDHSRFP
jgi:hypothetical protein